MTLPKPLITVVIPCHNKAKTIVRAIESIKVQTVNNLECFVILDRCTDNSLELVKKTIRKDKRFSYHEVDFGNVADTRNFGIAKGDAPFVMCLDGDDWVEKNFIEICIKPLLEDRSLGITYVGLMSHFEDGRSVKSRWPTQFSPDRQLSYSNKQNQVPTACVFRREAWERVGGYKSRYCPDGAGSEDAAFWSAITSIGYGAKQVTTKPLFNYSMDGGFVHGNKEYSEVDWLSMYPWASDGQHPFASVATPLRYSHPVRQYDEPLVSVIIPVGPGHESEVTNALDSLERQHFRKWEAIVVDDTDWVDLNKGRDYGDGKEYPGDWSYVFEPIKTAYPYIRLVGTKGLKGAGYARNRGVEIARSSLLLFLDADDLLSDSEALGKMINAWNNEQAIIYSDYYGKASWDYDNAIKKFGEVGQDRLVGWLNKTKQAVIRHQAADYDCIRAQQQPRFDPTRPNMPYFHWCLVSCLIPKVWHNAIGGFDETMETWEDVDYHWRLARAGYCFHRVPEPLVLYNYDGGHRRHKSAVTDEATRQKHQKMIEYLQSKYEGLETVVCNCGKSVSTSNNMAVPGVGVMATIADIPDEDMVLIEFTPNFAGNRAIVGMGYRGPDGKGINYGYGRRDGERFLVHKADIQAQPHLYKPVTQTTQTVTEAPEEKQPLPEPVKMVSEQFYPADLVVRFGLKEDVAVRMHSLGFNTTDRILEGDLTEVRGIGKATEKKIKAELQS